MDDFRTQFNLELPVDGYGLPSAFLGLLRLVCTNGMIGMQPAFKTVFQLGKGDDDLSSALTRIMATFNNEERIQFAQEPGRVGQQVVGIPLRGRSAPQDPFVGQSA